MQCNKVVISQARFCDVGLSFLACLHSLRVTSTKRSNLTRAHLKTQLCISEQRPDCGGEKRRRQSQDVATEKLFSRSCGAAEAAGTRRCHLFCIIPLWKHLLSERRHQS